jgi:hypothetical protein
MSRGRCAVWTVVADMRSEFNSVYIMTRDWCELCTNSTDIWSGCSWIVDFSLSKQIVQYSWTYFSKFPALTLLIIHQPIKYTLLLYRISLMSPSSTRNSETVNSYFKELFDLGTKSLNVVCFIFSLFYGCAWNWIWARGNQQYKNTVSLIGLVFSVSSCTFKVVSWLRP